MYHNIGTFYMCEKSLTAMEYLKKEKVNLSHIVRKALIKAAERQKLFNEKFPE